MEQTVGSTELVWNLLFSTTGADGRLCLALSERIKVVITYESVDGDGDTAQDAHSWSR